MAFNHLLNTFPREIVLVKLNLKNVSVYVVSVSTNSRKCQPWYIVPVFKGDIDIFIYLLSGSERPLVNYTGKGHVKFKTVLLSPFSFVSITEQITRNVSFESQEKIADV